MIARVVTAASLWLACTAVTAAELLVFTAATCPACDAFKRDAVKDPDLTSPLTVRLLPAGGREARAYRVTAVPTFVLVDGRREIARRVGYRGADDLRAWLDDAR